MSTAITVPATASTGQPAAIAPPAATGFRTACAVLPPLRENPLKPDVPTAFTSSAPFGSTTRYRVGLFGSTALTTLTIACWAAALTGTGRNLAISAASTEKYSTATGTAA